ncbi:putative C6 zinc finger domain-containing protein [Rosellinia necatrix]|uniref:Putative C6 zinc finger domain-containing protein n=1 Tax=Rosellinia necatrix TaxID=77044 RepID=A0A1S7URZ9_ROSNE|nr:putative C6 zinc finger domain-containing protein [Rosellinia necatrix]
MDGERRLPVRIPDGAPPREAKRRKVRKGTRSCWECRRRKIRCIYASEDALICANCESRGANCVSQEFADEQASTPDRRVTQRLGRVEEMLEKLVEKIMPDSYTASRGRHMSPSPVSAEPVHPESVDCPFAVGKPPMFDVLAPLRSNSKAPDGPCPTRDLPTPAPSPHEITVLCNKYTRIARTLYDLLPCQQDVDTIATASPAGSFIISFFSRYRDVAAGQIEDPSAIRVIPSPSSHPAVLARRLMQLTNCMQQIQPTTPMKLLAGDSTRCLMAKYVSVVSELVAHNDDLIGYAEGLETLALISLYHANAGNLRKAWLMLRRALSVAQLMGVDRWGDKPLKSADPMVNPSTLIKAQAFWFRLNFVDRYLSLLLGLPAGTDDNSFLADDPNDEPTDKLEKQHTVVMGAIIKRNTSKGEASFSITQAIDYDLEAAARSVASDFWQLPQISSFANTTSIERMRAVTQLMLQMNHHNLLILLHLPYMLRDPKERRWDYSKATCISSSRQLLRTFLLFRQTNHSSNACRHTDYGALTASMTLLLGYLDPKLQARDPATTSQREADRELIQEARDKLEEMAKKNDDKLARDAACIIGRLLPLLNPDLMATGGGGQGGNNEGVGEHAAIHLEIPYLGTININPSAHIHNTQHEVQPHAHTTPTPKVNTGGSTTLALPTDAAKTTPLSVSLNHNEYADFPSCPTLSTDWSPPSDQQHPTPVGGDGAGEACHTLSFPMGYSDNPNGFADLNSFPPMMQFEWSQAQLAHPELAAEADDWTFQGFDTTYFESLFSSGAQGL